MSTVVNHELIGRYAKYTGNSRRYIFGNRIYKIVDARKDGTAVMLNPESLVTIYRNENTWVNINYVELMADIPTFDVDEIFTTASGGPLEIAKAEIVRLEARISELKAAIKVIESV